MTPVQVLRRALAVNSAASSFAAKIPTVTRPFADGVIVIRNFEDTLDLYPFGAGNDNTTFDLRVTGWRQAIPSGSEYRIGTGAKNAFVDSNGHNASVLWIPAPIVEVTCTNSAIIGIAGAVAINTDRFADTIVINKGIGVVSTVIADSGCAVLTCDVSGYELIEITTSTTSSATNGNALYSLYAEAES